MVGAAIASCYRVAGGFTYPWLQALATQLIGFCFNVAIDLYYRSLYQRRKAEEAALAAATADCSAASKLQGLFAEGAATTIPQVSQKTEHTAL